MWPLGHVAIGYLLYTVSTRYRFDAAPEPLAVGIVVFGSLFPDLVDKPLAWYLGSLPTGRSLAHSLVFLVPLCLILYLILRHRGRVELAVAFAIGVISHTIVDAIPSLWRPDSDAGFLLYPFVHLEPYVNGPPSVIAMLMSQLTSPWFHLEFVLAAAAFVLWRRDGYPGLEYLGIYPGEKSTT